MTASRRARGRLVGAAALFAALATPASARAEAEACKTSVQPFACDPLPEGPEARRAILASLDLAARDAVAQHRLPDAARLFGCLLLGDPRPEHASNLAVALKQAGDVPAALGAATCAEQLSEGNADGLARAHARREELERLLVSRSDRPAPAASPRAAPSLSATFATPTRPPANAEPPPPVSLLPPAGEDGATRAPPLSGAPAGMTEQSGPQRARSRLRHGAALAGALLLAAGGAVAYMVARMQANQFQAEQNQNGYTARAQSLRDSAQRWQAASIGGLIGASVGGVGAVVSW